MSLNLHFGQLHLERVEIPLPLLLRNADIAEGFRLVRTAQVVISQTCIFAINILDQEQTDPLEEPGH